MKYRFIDHTADLSVEFFGKTIEELFVNSALSLSEIVFNATQSEIRNTIGKIHLNFSAKDLAVLYIDFLREILFQINTNFRYFYNIDIDKFLNNEISISCYYHTLNLDKIAQEIKAVTYHNIGIKKEKGIYSAVVTFDI
ncbi:MAG: archease [Candidatus Cloacimonadota bacterium]|nr:archease [Candidatus Cloacimonadota bacterium]